MNVVCIDGYNNKLVLAHLLLIFFLSKAYEFSFFEKMLKE